MKLTLSTSCVELRQQGKVTSENGDRATELTSRMLCHEKATMFGIVTSIILSEHMHRIISLRKVSVLLPERSCFPIIQHIIRIQEVLHTIDIR